VELVLEDYFNINLKLEQAGLGACQITGDFDSPVLEEVLEALSITLDIKIKQEKGIYSLSGTGCTKMEN
jgi:hypothetical protein